MLRFFSRFQADFQLKSGWIELRLVGGYAPFSPMGCIDNGETPLKVLAPALYEFFGLDTKECYRYYSAIKLRKNPSRTYFIDKMQKKLNEKIRRDEELDRMRR